MSLNRLAINNKFDLYTGLSLKNFRSHLGARYLFFEGFRVDTEVTFPIAKYSNDSSDLGFYIHNQFAFNIGAVFIV